MKIWAISYTVAMFVFILISLFILAISKDKRDGELSFLNLFLWALFWPAAVCAGIYWIYEIEKESK